jgi:hypothetical protein
LVFCFMCILMIIGSVLFSLCYYSRTGLIVCIVFAVVFTLLMICACISSECNSIENDQLERDVNNRHAFG